jgi:hypothetical protein
VRVPVTVFELINLYQILFTSVKIKTERMEMKVLLSGGICVD